MTSVLLIYCRNGIQVANGIQTLTPPSKWISFLYVYRRKISMQTKLCFEPPKKNIEWVHLDYFANFQRPFNFTHFAWNIVGRNTFKFYWILHFFYPQMCPRILAIACDISLIEAAILKKKVLRYLAASEIFICQIDRCQMPFDKSTLIWISR